MNSVKKMYVGFILVFIVGGINLNFEKPIDGFRDIKLNDLVQSAEASDELCLGDNYWITWITWDFYWCDSGGLLCCPI